MTQAREKKVNSLDGATFDVLVIGGGATGLGTAVNAATRGFSTLVLEQNDYAKGTSSRSTKILHGGVRYLAQGNIKLVHEALKEKLINYENAPHLARSMDFVIPCENFFKQMFYASGMIAYDALAGFPKKYLSKIVNHKTLNAELPEVAEKHKDLGVIYNDGQFDDARMAFALVRTLEDNKGVAVNYIKVVEFIKEGTKIVGVKALDKRTNKVITIKAKCIFNATGIYSDEIIKLDKGEHEGTVTLAQGIHIVVKGDVYSSQKAMLIPKTTDGRVLFFIPWYDKVIIGTTDTKVSTVLDDPIPLKEEIDLVINNANNYLSRPIQQEDITSVYAGIRPLMKATSSTKKISREEHIDIADSGLISVVGGKWTTYRHMGERLVNFAIAKGKLPQKESQTKHLKLHGYLPEDKAHAIPLALRFYGSELSKIKDMQGFNNNLHADLPINEAQVRYAMEFEQALTLDDVLARRTRCLFINAAACIEIADTAAKIMQEFLGFDDKWRKAEVEDFTKIAKKYLISSYW
ncbi:MAG: glycerol-3-phosphate dehydrogenase/oxidase [Alphaproteobacteria bacterium]|jgi:glycerol-3-phosphate dehydrogenase|nr:glycerol-3-phosphate dehydrogenase/oxidase [Alphaproteobacteria bacterium]